MKIIIEMEKECFDKWMNDLLAEGYIVKSSSMEENIKDALAVSMCACNSIVTIDD